MQKALIVQSDRTLLLDIHCETAEAARQAILPFAELEKSPEHIHTYRITPLSLWNAASAGYTPEDVVNALSLHSRYEIPAGITESFALMMARYGKIKMKEERKNKKEERIDEGNGGSGDRLELFIEDDAIRLEIAEQKALQKYLTKTADGFSLALTDRGTVKRELIRLGWPVQDDAPLSSGEYLEIKMRSTCLSGRPFAARDYQVTAAQSVIGSGGQGSGYGVVVLPCGSGKTIVGMLIMSMLKTNTLILTANVAAVHQWIEELLDKTELTKEQIGEYSGDCKQVAPVTVATYQIISWRPPVPQRDGNKKGDFPHFRLFRERQWGLVIYDEVHLLPAPVFRVTAELQAIRRLGLTATLIREDGEEDAVFSLVGPKRYDVPWKDLENKGWIAEAFCTEIRLELPENLKIKYAASPPREKYRIAGENPLKENIVLQLIEDHPEDQILIIGQYLSQLNSLAKLLKAPLVTGKTPNAEREEIYGKFKRGEVRVIVVSRVANFALDLPDASMAVQVSGTFGSRQEEAQRLGRILRPKNRRGSSNGGSGTGTGGSGTDGSDDRIPRSALFFSLVSHYTAEETFAANRQKFLTEQGYKYSIRRWAENSMQPLSAAFTPEQK